MKHSSFAKQKNILLISENFALRQVVKTYLHDYAKSLKIFTSDNWVEGLGFAYIVNPDVIIFESPPSGQSHEILKFLVNNDRFQTAKNIVVIMTEDSPVPKLPPNFTLLDKTTENALYNLANVVFDQTKTHGSKKPANFLMKLAFKLSVTAERNKAFSLPGAFLLNILLLFKRPVKDANIEQRTRDSHYFRSRRYLGLVSGFVCLAVLVVISVLFTVSQCILLLKSNQPTEAAETWQEIHPDLQLMSSISNLADHHVDMDDSGLNIIMTGYAGKQDLSLPTNLFTSTDGGQNWEIQLPQEETAVFAWNQVFTNQEGSKFFASGANIDDSDHKFFYSGNSGMIWQEVIPHAQANTLGGKITSGKDGSTFVFVSSDNNYYSISKNGGLTWSPIDEIITFCQSITCYTNTSNVISLNDDGSVVFITVVFTTISPESLNASILFKSIDGGESWVLTEPFAADERIDWVSMNNSSSTTLAFAGNDPEGEDQQLYLTRDTGNTWTPIDPTGVGTNIVWDQPVLSENGSVIALSGYSHIAAQYTYYLYTSTDNGLSWTLADPGEDHNVDWKDIKISPDGSKILVTGTLETSFDVIYFSQDSGSTWTPLSVSGIGGTISSWVSSSFNADASKIVLTGSLSDEREITAISFDQGDSWYTQHFYAPTSCANLYPFTNSNISNIILAYECESILSSYILNEDDVSFRHLLVGDDTDEIRSWNRMALNSTASVIVTSGEQSGHFYGLYYSHDSGQSWKFSNPTGFDYFNWTEIAEPSFNLISIPAISGDGSTSLLRIKQGNNYHIVISTDYGETWTKTEPEGSGIDYILLAQDTFINHDGSVIAISSYSPLIEDSLYISVDRGEIWTMKQFQHDVQSFAISEDGTKIVILTEIEDNKYSLMYSNNSGSTWSELTVPPEFSVRSSFQPPIIMNPDESKLMIYADYGYYVSNDFGNTWSEPVCYPTNPSCGSLLDLKISYDHSTILIETEYSEDPIHFFLSTDGGTNWTELTKPHLIEQGEGELTDITLSADGSKIGYVFSKGLYITTVNSEGDQTTTVPTPLNTFVPSATQIPHAQPSPIPTSAPTSNLVLPTSTQSVLDQTPTPTDSLAGITPSSTSIPTPTNTIFSPTSTPVSVPDITEVEPCVENKYELPADSILNWPVVKSITTSLNQNLKDLSAKSALANTVLTGVVDIGQNFYVVNDNLVYLLSLQFIGETTSKAVMSAVTLFALTAPSTAAAFSKPDLFYYALSWFWKRKQKVSWGIISDKITHSPIAFARINLSQNGEIVDSATTDLQGKYGFTVDKGRYNLTIAHSDYIGFSTELTVRKDEETVVFDYELSPKFKDNFTSQTSWYFHSFKKFVKSNLFALNTIIFSIGFVYTLFAVSNSFSIINYSILALYLLQIILIAVFYFSRTREWGQVIEISTGSPVAGAVIRVFDSEKQLDVTITDRQGRYSFIVKPGNYFIKVNVPGFVFPVSNSKGVVTNALGEKLVKFSVESTNRIGMNLYVKGFANLNIHRPAIVSPFG